MLVNYSFFDNNSLLHSRRFGPEKIPQYVEDLDEYKIKGRAFSSAFLFYVSRITTFQIIGIYDFLSHILIYHIFREILDIKGGNC